MSDWQDEGLSRYRTLPAQGKAARQPDVPETEIPAAFGHYSNFEFLGQGGMAHVYRAWDLKLQRPIALKFLLTQDPIFLQRFLAEARSQAKIQHPNVCKVFEVGEKDGRHYIAMQYIHGNTLTYAAHVMTLQQKIHLMVQVARAVHEAHQAGLIHRDLKPGNILVETNETGELIPYVVDFGLAREMQAPSLTVTGMTLGTPSYMSPEQVRGKSSNVDHRTDLYGLGATLYELLTKSPPHDGDSSAEILTKVLEQDPLPVRKRNPDIPNDLETIVMKCLEKNPNRRYVSAKAFADDLDRYIAGDPIEARRATIRYRVEKKIRKHPMTAALLAVAFIVVSLMGAYALIVRLQSQKQAQLMQEFGQQINEVEAIMRYAYLLPRHNVTRETKIVETRLKDIQQRMQEVGKTANGPGNYALGKGYLALRRYDKARNSLEKAWNLYNYREPQVAYALGLSLALLYQKELERASRLTNAAERLQYTQKIERELRDPSRQYIAKGASTRESTEYVQALILFLEKKYPEAISKAQNAVNQIPWLYEATKLQGDAYTEIANECRNTGQQTQALENYKKAEIAYRKASTSGSSDPVTYLAICSQKRELAFMALTQSNDPPLKSGMEGIETCKRAIECDPTSIESYLNISTIYYYQAYYDISTSGVDAFPSLENAIQWAAKAIPIDNQNSKPLTELASVYSLKAKFQGLRGQDAFESFKKADELLQRALSLESNSFAIFRGLAINNYYRAEYEVAQDLNPLPSIERSIRYYNEANKASSIRFYGDLGSAYYVKANFEMDHGIDPRDSVKHGIENLEKALKQNPKHEPDWVNCGYVWTISAVYEATYGINPEKSVQQSSRCFETALKISPGDPYALTGIGWVLNAQAQYQLMSDKDPRPILKEAQKKFQDTIQSNSQFGSSYVRQLEAYLIEAEYLVEKNQDPTKVLSVARDIAKRSLTSNLAEPHQIEQLLASGELLAARWEMQHKRSPVRHLDLSVDLAQDSLSKNARFAPAHLALADAANMRAEFKISKKENAESDLQESLKFAAMALTENPKLPEAYLARAKAFHLLSLSGSDSQRKENADNSKAAFQTAVQLNPLLQRKVETISP